jgi:hypothetical protein
MGPYQELSIKTLTATEHHALIVLEEIRPDDGLEWAETCSLIDYVMALCVTVLSQTDGSYTDLSSYCACTWALQRIRVYCIWVSPSYGSGSSVFSGVFIAE